MKDAKVECRGVRKRRVKFDRQRKLLSKRLEGVHLEVTPPRSIWSPTIMKRQTRIITLLVIDSLFFVLEIVVGSFFNLYD
jgi:hypothetical protein